MSNIKAAEQLINSSSFKVLSRQQENNQLQVIGLTGGRKIQVIINYSASYVWYKDALTKDVVVKKDLVTAPKKAATSNVKVKKPSMITKLRRPLKIFKKSELTREEKIRGIVGSSLPLSLIHI
jgi:hypothetical protein